MRKHLNLITLFVGICLSGVAPGAICTSSTSEMPFEAFMNARFRADYSLEFSGNPDGAMAATWWRDGDRSNRMDVVTVDGDFRRVVTAIHAGSVGVLCVWTNADSTDGACLDIGELASIYFMEPSFVRQFGTAGPVTVTEIDDVTAQCIESSEDGGMECFNEDGVLLLSTEIAASEAALLSISDVRGDKLSGGRIDSSEVTTVLKTTGFDSEDIEDDVFRPPFDVRPFGGFVTLTEGTP